jgi:hypothetical protein
MNITTKNLEKFLVRVIVYFYLVNKLPTLGYMETRKIATKIEQAGDEENVDNLQNVL